jgi:aspartokinase
MKKAKNFILAHINGRRFNSDEEILFEKIQNILESAREKNAKVIFFVSPIREVIELLNVLFGLWVDQKECKEFLNSLKEMLKKFSVQYKIEEETKKQMKVYYTELDFLLNKQVRCENISKDQAQILMYGELISSFIFRAFLSKNFPKKQSFFGDSSKIFLTDLNKNDSWVKAQVEVESSKSNIKTFLHINADQGDLFVFPEGVMGEENGDFAIKCPHCGILSVVLFNSVCSSLGKTEIIYW